MKTYMDKPSGKNRRTLKDIDTWLSATEIYHLITNKSWPYKSDDRNRLAKRDAALMSIDFVGAFRNNEPLKSLKKSNFEENQSWLILHGGKISKRTDKAIRKYGPKITVRTDIKFPKFQHPLQPFTDLVLNYLAELENSEVLFPFGERRHGQIVAYATASEDEDGKPVKGKWVHWLRAMGENWYGHNVFINDPVSLAKFIGVVNVQSVMGYVGFDEQSYDRRMKEATYTDRV